MIEDEREIVFGLEMTMITHQFTNDKGIQIMYSVNPQHRDPGNPNKSIWIVKPPVEIDCFLFTYNKGWVDECSAWGFLPDANAKLIELGIGTNNEILKLARFRKDPNAEEWHGYPCNYAAKIHDVPADTIMKDWVAQNYITKAKMFKIQHCLLCNL